jgi:hypothetical protein
MNAHRTNRRASGFNLVELLVIIGVVGFLAVNLLCVLAATHKHSGRINCVSNLKQIGVAFRTREEGEGNKYPMEAVLTNSETMDLATEGKAFLLWQTTSNDPSTPNALYYPDDKRRKAAALFSPAGEETESGKHLMQAVLTNNETMKLVTNGNAYLFWQAMSNDLSTPKILHCPDDNDDKRRKAATSFSQGLSDANISYFFSLDATNIYPQMILTGDDNLAVDGMRVKPGILTLSTNSAVAWTKEQHRFVGNLVMADGSAMQITTAGLKTAIVASTVGVPTNAVTPRWIIP